MGLALEATFFCEQEDYAVVKSKALLLVFSAIRETMTFSAAALPYSIRGDYYIDEAVSCEIGFFQITSARSV